MSEAKNRNDLKFTNALNLQRKAIVPETNDKELERKRKTRKVVRIKKRRRKNKVVKKISVELRCLPIYLLNIHEFINLVLS